jgi:hypothetical protein
MPQDSYFFQNFKALSYSSFVVWNRKQLSSVTYTVQFVTKHSTARGYCCLQRLVLVKQKNWIVLLQGWEISDEINLLNYCTTSSRKHRGQESENGSHATRQTVIGDPKCKRQLNESYRFVTMVYIYSVKSFKDRTMYNVQNCDSYTS